MLEKAQVVMIRLRLIESGSIGAGQAQVEMTLAQVVKIRLKLD